MNFPTIKHSIKILKPKPLKTQKPLFLSFDKKRGFFVFNGFIFKSILEMNINFTLDK